MAFTSINRTSSIRRYAADFDMLQATAASATLRPASKPSPSAPSKAVIRLSSRCDCSGSSVVSSECGTLSSRQSPTQPTADLPTGDAAFLAPRPEEPANVRLRTAHYNPPEGKSWRVVPIVADEIALVSLKAARQIRSATESESARPSPSFAIPSNSPPIG